MRSNRKATAAVLAVALGIGIGGVGNGCDKPSAATTQPTKGGAAVGGTASAGVSAPAPADYKPKSSGEAGKVEVALVRKLGLTNNRGEPRIVKVEKDGAGGYEIRIGLNDNLTKSLVRAGALNDVRDCLRTLVATDPSFTTVNVFGMFPIQGKDGNSRLLVGVYGGWKRGAVAGINWDSYDVKGLLPLGRGEFHKQLLD